VAFSSIQPFGHNRHGPITGVAATPSNATSPGPRDGKGEGRMRRKREGGEEGGT